MLISLKEAARRLGLSKPRVLMFIKAGRLKARQLDNGIYLIESSDLKAVENRKPGRPYPPDYKPSSSYLRRKKRDEKSK